MYTVDGLGRRVGFTSTPPVRTRTGLSSAADSTLSAPRAACERRPPRARLRRRDRSRGPASASPRRHSSKTARTRSTPAQHRSRDSVPLANQPGRLRVGDRRRPAGHPLGRGDLRPIVVRTTSTATCGCSAACRPSPSLSALWGRCTTTDSDRRRSPSPEAGVDLEEDDRDDDPRDRGPPPGCAAADRQRNWTPFADANRVTSRIGRARTA